MRKIEVVASNDRQGKYLLRLYLSDKTNQRFPGVIRFETEPAFSKQEADCLAMMLSTAHGMDRDELPTHPQIQADPKEA